MKLKLCLRLDLCLDVNSEQKIQLFVKLGCFKARKR